MSDDLARRCTCIGGQALTPPELQFLLKPAEIQRDPILTIRAVALLERNRRIEESAQVNVTRMTVSDRRLPPEPAPYGTQMARRLSVLPRRYRRNAPNREAPPARRP